MKRKLNIRHLLLLCIPICLVIGFSISIFYRNSEPSNPSENQKVEDQPNLSLEHFLEIAMEPVGQTMYVWGGGWNEEDTGAGVEAVTIGVSDQWASFFEEQDASYDYQNTCTRFTMDWTALVMSVGPSIISCRQNRGRMDM